MPRKKLHDGHGGVPPAALAAAGDDDDDDDVDDDCEDNANQAERADAIRLKGLMLSG